MSKLVQTDMPCLSEITASSHKPASFEALKQIKIFKSMSHRLNHKGESSTMTCPACNIPLSIKDVHLDTFHSMCVWLYRNWKPLSVFENN